MMSACAMAKTPHASCFRDTRNAEAENTRPCSSGGTDHLGHGSCFYDRAAIDAAIMTMTVHAAMTTPYCCAHAWSCLRRSLCPKVDGAT